MKKFIRAYAERTLTIYGFEHKKTIRAFWLAELLRCW